MKFKSDMPRLLDTPIAIKIEHEGDAVISFKGTLRSITILRRLTFLILFCF